MLLRFVMIYCAAAALIAPMQRQPNTKVLKLAEPTCGAARCYIHAHIDTIHAHVYIHTYSIMLTHARTCSSIRTMALSRASASAPVTEAVEELLSERVRAKDGGGRLINCDHD